MALPVLKNQKNLLPVALPVLKNQKNLLPVALPVEYINSITFIS